MCHQVAALGRPPRRRRRRRTLQQQSPLAALRLPHQPARGGAANTTFALDRGPRLSTAPKPVFALPAEPAATTMPSRTTARTNARASLSPPMRQRMEQLCHPHPPTHPLATFLVRSTKIATAVASAAKPATAARFASPAFSAARPSPPMESALASAKVRFLPPAMIQPILRMRRHHHHRPQTAAKSIKIARKASSATHQNSKSGRRVEMGLGDSDNLIQNQTPFLNYPGKITFTVADITQRPPSPLFPPNFSLLRYVCRQSDSASLQASCMFRCLALECAGFLPAPVLLSLTFIYCRCRACSICKKQNSFNGKCPKKC